MTRVIQRKTKAEFRDDRMVRMRNIHTGKLLHLSGNGDAAEPAYAWLGYRHQARQLRLRAEIRGEPWPYRAEAR